MAPLKRAHQTLQPHGIKKAIKKSIMTRAIENMMCLKSSTPEISVLPSYSYEPEFLFSLYF